uniref:Chitin-binding type-2 domain-containing protein n=1 Tax=Panagrellus redivivus TaxID=6233 RepID=A0A7E4VEE2_PANRE
MIRSPITMKAIFIVAIVYGSAIWPEVILAQEFKRIELPGSMPISDAPAIPETAEPFEDSPEEAVSEAFNDPQARALPEISAPYYPPPPPAQPQQPYYPPPGYELPQQPPPRPMPLVATPEPTPEPAKNGYSINYCDKTEFPDAVLESYGLRRLEYFIYNTSCSEIFFQCSIGRTFMLKCPSVTATQQSFDPSIVNCNYRVDNKICPEYDHVVHCTIKDTCTPNQFACCAMPQSCIDMSRRCDGHPDCADGEDETNCPSCAKDEFACVKSDKCIPHSKRCDGVPDDCNDGSNLDEIGCSKNTTCWGKFVCDSPTTLAQLGHADCIDYALHCDGTKHCPGGEDELNCRRSDAKYLLCENQKQSVTKEQWCDGQEHCADGSDERYCY